MQRSALCRSRRELSNEYLLAKFGFDTAEKEPCKVCPLSAYRSPRFFIESNIPLVHCVAGKHYGGRQAKFGASSTSGYNDFKVGDAELGTTGDHGEFDRICSPNHGFVVLYIFSNVFFK